MSAHPFFQLLFAIFLVSIGCGNPASTSESTDDTDHPGTFHTIEKKYGQSQLDGYNLYVPRSCTADSAPFPVIVFLQGGLGVGGKVRAILNWELPKELKETRGLDSEINQLKLNTFVYVMPHLSQGEFYFNVGALLKILDEVTEQYNVDEKRIYLTGLSRGGHGTWGVASKIPDRFAAIAPVAGAPFGVSEYEGLAQLPIWVAHNVKDDKVDYYRSEKAVRRIEYLTGEKFHPSQTVAEADYLHQDRIFTSGENKAHPHDAWTELYNEVNFYKWLLRFTNE
jgi:predicted peptidase